MWSDHVSGARGALLVAQRHKIPSVSGTNKKHIKTRYDPKKRKTPIRDATALLFNNSYLRVCDDEPT